MSFCTGCVTQLSDTTRFCTACGKPAPEDAQNNATDDATRAMQPNHQSSYEQNNQSNNRRQYQQSYAQAGGYAQAPNAYAQTAFSPPPMYTGVQQSAMSVGAYIGTLLLLMIPLVGLSLMIVWAYGASSNRNRINLARAMLIVCAILIVIVLLISLLFGAAIKQFFYGIYYTDLLPLGGV